MLGRKSAARRGRSTSAFLCLGGILAALAPAWGERVDPALHWPAPPAEVERLLAEVPFRIVSVRGDVGGVMGVRKVGLVFEPSGREMAAKGKAGCGSCPSTSRAPART